MTRGKVLVVGSNATRIEVQGGGTGPTGNYLNETVVPAMALIEAGYHLVLATPNGTKPHIDEASDSVAHFGGDQAAYARAKAFWANDPAVNQVHTLRAVIQEGLDSYAGVFVPGGQVITGSVDFAPNVVVDRELITGQNPRSDHSIAAKLIEVLANPEVKAA